MLVGGLAVFLYGMLLMNDSLTAFAGERLQGIMLRLTKDKFRGYLTGFGVTVLGQLVAIPKLSKFSILIIAIGFFGSFLAKTKRNKHLTRIVPGFGLLFPLVRHTPGSVPFQDVYSVMAAFVYRITSAPYCQNYSSPVTMVR